MSGSEWDYSDSDSESDFDPNEFMNRGPKVSLPAGPLGSAQRPVKAAPVTGLVHQSPVSTISGDDTDSDSDFDSDDESDDDQGHRNIYEAPFVAALAAIDASIAHINRPNLKVLTDSLNGKLQAALAKDIVSNDLLNRAQLLLITCHAQYVDACARHAEFLKDGLAASKKVNLEQHRRVTNPDQLSTQKLLADCGPIDESAKQLRTQEVIAERAWKYIDTLSSLLAGDSLSPSLVGELTELLTKSDLADQAKKDKEAAEKAYKKTNAELSRLNRQHYLLKGDKTKKDDLVALDKDREDLDKQVAHLSLSITSCTTRIDHAKAACDTSVARLKDILAAGPSALSPEEQEAEARKLALKTKFRATYPKLREDELNRLVGMCKNFGNERGIQLFAHKLRVANLDAYKADAPAKEAKAVEQAATAPKPTAPKPARPTPPAGADPRAGLFAQIRAAGKAKEETNPRAGLLAQIRAAGNTKRVVKPSVSPKPAAPTKPKPASLDPMAAIKAAAEQRRAKVEAQMAAEAAKAESNASPVAGAGSSGSATPKQRANAIPLSVVQNVLEAIANLSVNDEHLATLSLGDIKFTINFSERAFKRKGACAPLAKAIKDNQSLSVDGVTLSALTKVLEHLLGTGNADEAEKRLAALKQMIATNAMSDDLRRFLAVPGDKAPEAMSADQATLSQELTALLNGKALPKPVPKRTPDAAVAAKPKATTPAAPRKPRKVSDKMAALQAKIHLPGAPAPVAQEAKKEPSASAKRAPKPKKLNMEMFASLGANLPGAPKAAVPAVRKPAPAAVLTRAQVRLNEKIKRAAQDALAVSAFKTTIKHRRATKAFTLGVMLKALRERSQEAEHVVPDVIAAPVEFATPEPVTPVVSATEQPETPQVEQPPVARQRSVRDMLASHRAAGFAPTPVPSSPAHSERTVVTVVSDDGIQLAVTNDSDAAEEIKKKLASYANGCSLRRHWRNPARELVEWIEQNDLLTAESLSAKITEIFNVGGPDNTRRRARKLNSGGTFTKHLLALVNLVKPSELSASGLKSAFEQDAEGKKVKLTGKHLCQYVTSALASTPTVAPAAASPLVDPIPVAAPAAPAVAAPLPAKEEGVIRAASPLPVVAPSPVAAVQAASPEPDMPVSPAVTPPPTMAQRAAHFNDLFAPVAQRAQQRTQEATEQARREAERLAAEEAARVEAARVEAERLAAEEAARQAEALLQQNRSGMMAEDELAAAIENEHKARLEAELAQRQREYEERQRKEAAEREAAKTAAKPTEVAPSVVPSTVATSVTAVPSRRRRLTRTMGVSRGLGQPKRFSAESIKRLVLDFLNNEKTRKKYRHKKTNHTDFCLDHYGVPFEAGTEREISAEHIIHIANMLANRSHGKLMRDTLRDYIREAGVDDEFLPSADALASSRKPKSTDSESLRDLFDIIDFYSASSVDGRSTPTSVSSETAPSAGAGAQAAPKLSLNPFMDAMAGCSKEAVVDAPNQTVRKDDLQRMILNILNDENVRDAHCRGELCFGSAGSEQSNDRIPYAAAMTVVDSLCGAGADSPEHKEQQQRRQALRQAIKGKAGKAVHVEVYEDLLPVKNDIASKLTRRNVDKSKCPELLAPLLAAFDSMRPQTMPAPSPFKDVMAAAAPEVVATRGASV